jgi:hypothetical protein
MKDFFKGLLKAYAILAAYALALAALVVAALFWRGAVTGERVQAAFQALRARPPAPDAEAVKRPLDSLSEREQILEKRSLELQKLEDRTVSRLIQIRAEQEGLDAKQKEAALAAAGAKKAQEDYAQTKSDAELSANVPILSRMEAPGIVSVLKSGDDARFVRYLRALRPGKAAEVLEALRTDPQFEEEFRRVPPEAPPGTKSRAERLNEEFKKAP